MELYKKKSMDELGRLDTDTFKQASHHPVIIILDNVRSMNNVGSAFRTADGFNVEKLILGGITPTPPHREIQKTALGATESVQWEHHTDLTPCLLQLKAEGFIIVGIEQVHNSVSLQDWHIPAKHKVAFVFGNEVEGVSEEILKQCDACIEIPQFGSKHSFNISVTVGIILWEYTKQLKYISHS